MNEYKKQLTRSKVRVGIVVTAGLAVLFLMVLLSGNLQSLFSPHVEIYTTFNNVQGLQEGAPVWFSGVQIGSVGPIEFVTGARIRVPLSVRANVLQYIKRDSRATIRTLGLLGDKYVEIGPGTPGSPGIKPGQTIPGAPPEDMSGLIDKLQSKKSTIGRLLNEDTLYRELLDSLKDIKAFTESIRSSKGTLEKFIKDPALYEKFVKATQSLDAFTKKITASKGTINSLLEDESLYNNLNDAARKMNALLDSVNTGQGTVGRLIADRELSEELQSTLREVNALIKDIKENPNKYFRFSVF